MVETGKRIRQARKASKMTQGQLADALGYSQPTVVAWEKGVQIPSLPVLHEIAQATGCQLSYLTEDGGEAPAPRDDAPLTRADLAEILAEMRAIRLLLEERLPAPTHHD